MRRAVTVVTAGVEAVVAVEELVAAEADEMTLREQNCLFTMLVRRPLKMTSGLPLRPVELSLMPTTLAKDLHSSPTLHLLRPKLPSRL